ETIRQIGRASRELVEADYREWEIADVGVEFVHVAARAAVDVREEHLLLALLEQHLPDQLELTIARLASAAQDQSILSLNDLRVEDDDAKKFPAKIFPSQPQPGGDLVFAPHFPAPAERSEVAGFRAPADERVPAKLGPVRDVEEA